MAHWWAWHGDIELGGCDKDEVEYLTGRIPLFLKECIVKGEDEKDKIKLDDNPFFQNVYEEVISYEQALQGKCTSVSSKNKYVTTTVLPT
jgi:hypothetical protein